MPVTTTLPIKGMHCASCVLRVQDALMSVQGVQKATVSLSKKTAAVEMTEPLPAASLAAAVESVGDGYGIGSEKLPFLNREAGTYKTLGFGAAIAAAIGGVLWLSGAFQAVGIQTTNGPAWAVALVIGLTAGISTCMALVGGLVLGLSTQYSQAHPEQGAWQKFRPHIVFNIARLTGFILLGGVIGKVGSVLQLRGLALGLLMMLVGVTMLLLGLRLSKLFPRLGNGLTLPPRLAAWLGLTKSAEGYSHRRAATLGVLSFFLPCGFTQSMQLFAVSTGSFWQGALIMGMFAVGTAPGLLGIGGLAATMRGRAAQIFAAFAAVAVFGFGLLTISQGYRIAGIPARLNAAWGSIQAGLPDGNRTVLRAGYDADGIDTKTFTVKAGQKYSIAITPSVDVQGCMSTVMIPGLVDKPQPLRAGKTVSLNFTAPRTCEYCLLCAMGLPHGAQVIVEDSV